MKKIIQLVKVLFLGVIMMTACDQKAQKQPHVVFVIGDEEYRSEESMPMLADIVQRELNAKVTLCYSVDSAGFIDPNRSDHIEKLQALETADLMVMFTRFRALPDDELKYILDYAESGKPMVGFRTSTHAFMYKDDSSKLSMNEEWPSKVFGQKWITHHGHFEDGHAPLTSLEMKQDVQSELLTELETFDAYSWLYHVEGGDYELYGDSQPFLWGTSKRSKHEMEGRLDQFPLTNPVAWTKTYTGSSGQASKVFFTTLGHPYDWKNENMRRLAMNGIYWVLDMEIPSVLNVDFVEAYDPNNSGFGMKYKQGRKP